MQEQPPPDVEPPEEVPPQGWHGLTHKKNFTAAMVITLVFMLVVVVLLSSPMILRSSKAAERTEAISNSKQVGLALLEFDQEYGRFPHETTVAEVRRTTSTGIDLSGSSSNAMFRQLIAYGIQSEDIFYCGHPEFRDKRPDNKIRGPQALEPGEVRFSYVAGLDTSMNPSLPLLAAPMKLGTTSFHDKPFSDKGVILRADLSAKALTIRAADGRLTIGGGQTLFDPKNGIWPAGHVIDLRHPEK
ncbi:hypothetical protein [Haloferula rosea]|nr:hypothetical protein [Haloferula rosea]